MTGHDPNGSEPAATTPSPDPTRPGDIGRRIAYRRRELGLSRRQLAADAGVSPQYVRYVEEQPAEVEPGSLLRLAGALRTTTGDLLGGDADLPPGGARAGAHPVLEEMTPPDCWERLGTHGVGRIALPAGPAVDVLPVNYSVVDSSIVYRTTPSRAADAAHQAEVSFEVDRVDDALRQGWSVLAVGPARRVTDPAESRALDQRAGSGPWAGGSRPAWVSISPLRLTGRRVSAR